jgi:predicted transcriptional regulator
MYGHIMRRTQISLTDEDRNVLDAEAARSGRSISALIRDAIAQTYGVHTAAEDVRAIDAALGAWADRVVDGEAYVDGIRSGDRLRPAMTR